MELRGSRRRTQQIDRRGDRRGRPRSHIQRHRRHREEPSAPRGRGAASTPTGTPSGAPAPTSPPPACRSAVSRRCFPPTSRPASPPPACCDGPSRRCTSRPPAGRSCWRSTTPTCSTRRPPRWSTWSPAPSRPRSSARCAAASRSRCRSAHCGRTISSTSPSSPRWPSTTCADLLAEMLDGPVESPSAERLWRLSAGNALLLRELVIAAHASGEMIQLFRRMAVDRPARARPEPHRADRRPHRAAQPRCPHRRRARRPRRADRRRAARAGDGRRRRRARGGPRADPGGRGRPAGQRTAGAPALRRGGAQALPGDAHPPAEGPARRPDREGGRAPPRRPAAGRRVAARLGHGAGPGAAARRRRAGVRPVRRAAGRPAGPRPRSTPVAASTRPSCSPRS